MKVYHFYLILLLTLFATFSASAQDTRGELTEGEFLERWGYGEQQSWEPTEVKVETKDVVSGKECLLFETKSGLDTCVYFPNTMDLNLDLNKAAFISLQIKSDNGDKWFGGGQPWFIFVTPTGRLRISPKGSPQNESKKGWVSVVVPIHQKFDTNSRFNYEIQGEPFKSLARRVEIHADTGGYGFKMWYDAVKITDVAGRPFIPKLVSLDLPDLDVTYIERTPKYHRYMVDYSGPHPVDNRNKQCWPKKGEQVTWIGHVKNYGHKDSAPMRYAWYLNGRMAGSGMLPALKVGQETTIKLKLKWTQKRQKLALNIDASRPEICKENNQLEIVTDALTYGFHIEKPAYKRMSSVTSIIGSFSAEDWLNHNVVEAINEMFQKSVYPEFPNGVIQRVRIDKIKIYDDGSLPEGGTHAPETDETDGVWGYGSKHCQEYLNTSVFKNQALMHELQHQLGVIDLYQMNLNPQNDKITGKGWSWPHPHGLMGGGRIGKHKSPILSDNSVFGLNATYGYRRGWFGEYLFLIPEKCYISVTLNGKPVANAPVKVYQKKVEGVLEGPPVITGKTDGKGIFLLPNRDCETPFTTATDCTLKDNPFGKINVVGFNGLFLVSVEANGKTYGKFLPLADFNVAYARNKKKAVFPIELTEKDAYEPLTKYRSRS